MLFISLSSLNQLLNLPSDVEAIELRLDRLELFDIAKITEAFRDFPIPYMFTLRSVKHGGMWQGSTTERFTLINALLKNLSPPFFDLEYDMPEEELHYLISTYPKTKWILSYHNFERTLSYQELENLYFSISNFMAYSYKIAVYPKNSIEALESLFFAKKHIHVSMICMGPYGPFARVLGPVVGNLIDFGCLSEADKTAPGQLSFDDWTQIYRYNSLNPETAIYALIGDPVEQSQGHFYHNKVFTKKTINAVYVKIPLIEADLPSFFSLAKELNIQGISVTMPLKEKVLDFCHHLDEKSSSIGAINTLMITEDGVFGSNTDGKGALDAIEEVLLVKGKKLVILGAGGAAKAIAFEAIQRGANVYILNRTVEHAKQVAEPLQCHYGSLSDVPLCYDILVQASAGSIPIPTDKILPSSVCMDVVYTPKDTPFLEQARILGATIIYGEKMFLYQAALQNHFWFEESKQTLFISSL